MGGVKEDERGTLVIQFLYLLDGTQYPRAGRFYFKELMIIFQGYIILLCLAVGIPEAVKYIDRSGIKYEHVLKLHVWRPDFRSLHKKSLKTYSNNPARSAPSRRYASAFLLKR